MGSEEPRTPSRSRRLFVRSYFLVAILLVFVYALSSSSSDASTLSTSSINMVAVRIKDDGGMAAVSLTTPSIGTKADLSNKYTVRLNTWQRPLALKRGVRRMLSCPEVAQVVVVWTDPADPPSASELAGGKEAADGGYKSIGGRVVVERHSVNGLNERFLPLDQSATRTTGVLSIDDDLMPTCDVLRYAFHVWQEHPLQMVGWYPRQSIHGSPGYNHVLTKGAFFHRKYLAAYGAPAVAPARAMVQEFLNCEDLLMSYVVSNATLGLPPLWVDAGMPFETAGKLFGGHAIHADGSFLANRKKCRQKFAKMFRPGTLQTSSMIRYGHVDWDTYYTQIPSKRPRKILPVWARFWEYVGERLTNLNDYLFMSR